MPVSPNTGAAWNLWMGPGYSASFPVLAILTIGMMAHLMEMPAHTVLLGLCKHTVVAFFTLIQGLANIILSVILVRRLGVVGVTLGMMPMTLLTGLALSVYFRVFLKLSLLDYLRRSCISAILVQAPFIAVVMIIRCYHTPTTLAAFFGAVALAALPYFAITILVCVTRGRAARISPAAQRIHASAAS